MAININVLNNPLVYNYHYDQLNRIRQMDAYSGWNTVTNLFTPVKLDDYQERVAYDPNGNIQTYVRHGTQTGGQPLAMDSLTYGYYDNTNQLQHIADAVSSSNYSTDIDDQTTAANYTYDQIGNLKTDVASGITNIDWTVYGKIASITNASGTISYTYDAGGNRITKTAGGVTTIYVRDAQGNVMSVYRDAASVLKQTEVDLYGSSRLGLVGALTVAPTTVTLSGGYGTAMLSTFTRGEKTYELGNHLGNVLATISDRKIGVSSDGSSLIDHYTADVLTAQDYYPFGMQMPGRNYAECGAGSYRYGFNGKENDNEVKGVADQIDYGMRLYDPRVGKFLSVDPLTNKYPELTPYQYASGNPIMNIDLDGLEGFWYFLQRGDWMGAFNHLSWDEANEAAGVVNNAIPATAIVNGSIQVVTGKDPITWQPASRIDGAGNIIIGAILHRSIGQATAPGNAAKLEKQMAENAAAGSNKAANSAHGNSGSAESNTANSAKASVGSEGGTAGITSSNVSAPVHIIETPRGGSELTALKVKVQNTFKGINKVHLDAAIGDMAGNPVVKGGKTWDHLNDITVHLRGLNRQIKRLNTMINDNFFTGEVLKEATGLRSSLQNQYDSYLEALQRAAKKYGKDIDVKSKH